MTRFTAREKMAICRDLSSIAYGISGVRIGVYPIPVTGPDQNELAFTNAGRKIYIGFDHPIISKMEQDKALVLVYGLFTHEILHQLMSDFSILDHAINRLPFGQQQIFAELNNILEDSSIEYFMPQFIGGRLIDDLNFMRAWLYKESSRIDQDGNEKHPYFQFTTAFIQYGDAGLIKGDFTFPEAEKCFFDTIKLWEQGVVERHAHRRIQISDEIFQVSRPLWEDVAKNNELMQLLAELFRAFGKGHKSGAGGESPLFLPGDEEMPESARENRRKITFKRVSKEEADKIMEEGSAETEIPPDGDITILITDDEPDQADGGSEMVGMSMPGAGKPGEKDSMEADDSPLSTLQEESPETGSDVSESGKGIASKDDSMPGSPSGTEETSESVDASGEADGEMHSGDGGSIDWNEDLESVDAKAQPEDMSGPDERDESADAESVAATIEDELEIPGERLEELKTTLEKAEMDMRKEEEAEHAASSEPLDLPLSNYGYENVCKGKSCLNVDVKLSLPDLDKARQIYDAVLQKIQTEVFMLAGELRRLFATVEDDKARRTSGKVNIDRLCSGRLTSRVFDKRREASDRSDVAFFLVVDESGSMYGDKIFQAMITSIGLAEALSDSIPVYVMGFRADEEADAVHYHYMRWRNTKDNRLKLLNIHAGGNNFDGYSIRYACELLKKRQEKHKILIVVSDGAPECDSYSARNGKEDTRQAVREASQTATVVGVLIGNINPDTHKILYGYNFLHVKDASDLFYRIGGFLANLIKGW